MKNEQALFTTMRFNFLFVDRYVFHSGWVYPESRIPYNMFRFIVKGEAVFTINGQEICVKENQVVYIPEGCELACRTLCDYFEFYSIRFRLTTQMSAGDFLSEYFHIQPVTEAGADREVLRYFQQIYQNATGENPGRVFYIRGYLELVVAWLTERSRREDAPEERDAAGGAEPLWRSLGQMHPSKQDPRILVVMDHLHSHPAEMVNEEHLSQIAGVSKSTLRRLFKQHNGKTVGDYVLELRMQAAARMLLVSDKNISDIAYYVGYNSPGYFTRMFKRFYGTSPYAYRKNARI